MKEKVWVAYCIDMVWSLKKVPNIGYKDNEEIEVEPSVRGRVFFRKGVAEAYITRNQLLWLIEKYLEAMQ